MNPTNKKLSGDEESRSKGSCVNPYIDNVKQKTISTSSLLDYVLPMLRPFQKEAFEFATQGKLYDRQIATSDETATTDTTTTPNKKRMNVNSKEKEKQKGSTNIKNLSDKKNATALVGKGRILLADEMGLGKTVTSLAIMAYYENEWPLLIICPSSLRYIWPSEIEKFFPSILPQSVYVATGFNDIDFIKRIDSIKIVIITYSLIQNRSTVCHALLNECQFKCVIVDESHNMKQKTSQRTKLLMPILTRAKRLILLSGTPALARPVELWTQLHCLSPFLFGTFTQYTTQYCNPQRKYIGRGKFASYTMDYNGSCNEEELHEKLRFIMVRRLKCHVLSELPPKERSIIPIHIGPDNDEYKQCVKIIEEMNEKSSSVSLTDNSYDARTLDFEAKSAMMQAYQQTGIGKAKGVADYISEVWWPGTISTQKILIFAHHKAVMDTIEEMILQKFPMDSHIRIDGSVNAIIRQQLVRKFQTCSRTRIGLLSMTAAGVGLTLTAASTVLFAELHWTPGVLAQAEDRVHRIGQNHSSVQIIYMICKDKQTSIDPILWNMLSKKIGTLNQVIDGNNHDKPYLHEAKEDSNYDSNAIHEKQGQSVPDELSRFFAETEQKVNVKTTKTPTKGSIQQFFIKQTKMNQEIAASTVTQAATITPLMDRTVPVCTNENLPQKSTNFVWNCQFCTFSNQKRISATGHYSCEICHKRFESTSSSPSLLSPDAKLQSKNVISLPIDSTNIETSVTWNCSACTFKNTRKVNEQKCYMCEICGIVFLPSSGNVQICSDHELSHTPLRLNAAEALHTSISSAPSSTNDRFNESVDLTSTESNDGLPFAPIDSNPDFIEVYNQSSTFLTPTQESLANSSNSDFAIHILDFADENDAREERVDVLNCKEKIEKIGSSPLSLAFSVSKNTNRITVHVQDSGLYLSTEVNFDVEDILSDDTMNRILNSKVQRTTARYSATEYEFNEENLIKILDRVNTSIPFTTKYHTTDKRLTSNHITDFKKFAYNFLKLRPIEKKLLKESGRPCCASNLEQDVAKMMVNSKTTTDRYTGGAKERAREHIASGLGNDFDFAVVDGKGCVWCGTLLSSSSITAKASYCSQLCAEEGRLRRGGKYASLHIRAAVFALEGGKCNICGVNAHELYKQIEVMQPPERLNKLLSVQWKLPKSSKALEKLLQEPKEGNFWQVDHIRAVSEGGGSCGLENMRTLCVPCHILETEKLHQRLKHLSPTRPMMVKESSTAGEVSTTDATTEQNQPKKRIQVDIRHAFAITSTKRSKGNSAEK